MGFLAGLAASAAGSLAQGAFNSRSAQAQMDFQERMSNTAHQREAKDLEAAGLNRILSLGNGASSPSGSMTEFSGLGDTLQRGVSADSEMKLQRAQETQIASTVELQKSQAAQADAAAMASRSASAEADGRIGLQDAQKSLLLSQAAAQAAAAGQSRSAALLNASNEALSRQQAAKIAAESLILNEKLQKEKATKAPYEMIEPSLQRVKDFDPFGKAQDFLSGMMFNARQAAKLDFVRPTGQMFFPAVNSAKKAKATMSDSLNPLQPTKPKGNRLYGH